MAAHMPYARFGARPIRDLGGHHIDIFVVPISGRRLPAMSKEKKRRNCLVKLKVRRLNIEILEGYLCSLVMPGQW